MTLTVITENLEELVPPVADSIHLVESYRQDVTGSATANEIFGKLDHSGLNIGVLLIEQGADSMYIPPFIFDGDGLFSGGVVVLNQMSPLNVRGTDLPLAVSLIHELGHAVQYIGNPADFQARFEEAHSGETTRTTFNITDCQGRALTRSYRNTEVAKLLIENDNVACHEAPVCDELGLPFRKKYD